jgi:CPA2 family monovalent cation:H+ antiporter-2
VIPITAVAVTMLLVAALSASILPPGELLVLVLAAGAGLVALLWRRLVRLHARLQIALLDTLADKGEHD